jgi:hypothetical protein
MDFLAYNDCDLHVEKVGQMNSGRKPTKKKC